MIPPLHPGLGLAIEHHRAGRLSAAEEGYRAVLAEHPEHPVALHLLGVLAHDVGKHALGAELVEHALRILPKYPEAWANISDIYAALYRLEDAERAARRALELKPGDTLASLNLGVALGRQHRRAEALPPLRHALHQDPSPKSYHNITILMRDMEAYDEARANARAAFERWPDSPMAVGDMADLLRLTGKTDDILESARLMDRALERWPDATELPGTAALVYSSAGRMEDANHWMRRGMELEPDAPISHFNMAMLLLNAGDYAAGWEEYEHRLRLRNNDGPWRKLTQPLWRGQPLENRTLLIVAEQGYGDAMLFARFASRLAMDLSRGGNRVFLACPPPLVRLLASLPGLAGVVDWERELLPFDYHVPLMSLARHFQIRPDNIPHEPLLRAPEDALARWERKIAPHRTGGGLQVGLSWKGRSFPDPRRSCPLPLLAPLGDIPGVTFHSLQVGPAAEEAPPRKMRLIAHSRDLTDFAESAALLAQLDVLITVDTATAHLAGATGATGWVMLPIACDWRWTLQEPTTPWYETIRLFRQQSLNDWPGVIAEVAAALRQRVAQGPSKMR